MVRTEGRRRPESQAENTVATCHQVVDVYSVLAMGHEDALFEPKITEIVEPHRQPVVELELDQTRRVGGPERPHALLGTQDYDRPVGQAHAFPEVAQEHHATEWGGQCGHQQSVVPARDRTRDGPRRVATEAVSDEPFRLQELRLVDFVHAPGAGGRVQPSVSPSRSGRMTIADSPGRCQPSSPSTGGVPKPP